MTLRMCSTEGCKAPDHVENCPECFGWGKDADGAIINASEATTWQSGARFRQCSICGGTPLGRYAVCKWRLVVAANDDPLVETVEWDPTQYLEGPSDLVVGVLRPGQASGFTREDVKVIQDELGPYAEDEPADAEWMVEVLISIPNIRRILAIADRIEALLPPEEKP